MAYLKFHESILNCCICRNLGLRRHSLFSKHYIEGFKKETQQLGQLKYMQASLISSCEKLIKNITKLKKYKSHKDNYEKIYRKSLTTGVKMKAKKSNTQIKKHHKKMPAITYQVYTLTTDNEKSKKPSRSVYSYPFSSSSSETSSSYIAKEKKRLKCDSNPNGCSDDEDTDSEFSSCNKFPITEKHYRHIVDGIKCPSSQQNKPSVSKKPKEDKHKITKRADESFNQINYKEKQSRACPSKPKKKCHCKSKCKPAPSKVEEDEGSDSELSEKTFTKFINSLHSYVNRTKKYDHKPQRKRLSCDSSSSLCTHEEHIKKKKTIREHDSKFDSKEHDANKHHHHHSHHHHHQKQYKTDPKDILKKYLHE